MTSENADASATEPTISVDLTVPQAADTITVELTWTEVSEHSTVMTLRQLADFLDWPVEKVVERYGEGGADAVDDLLGETRVEVEDELANLDETFNGLERENVKVRSTVKRPRKESR